jgi:type IV pilus assembly protein PilF
MLAHQRRISWKLWLPIALAFSWTISGCATPKRDREEAELRLRIGTSFLAQGNYPNALRELLIAERLAPRNPVIQNNLGLAYFLRDRPETAAEHLQKALKLQPDYSEARNNYARVLIELTRYNQAIGELKKVLNDLTYDDPAKAWVNIGLAHFRKKDFASAKNSFIEAIKLNRNHCMGQTYYGRSLLELGEVEASVTALDNAIVVCKSSTFEEPQYYSGLAYYKLGRTSSAISRMEEIVKNNPQGDFAKRAESMLKLMK